MQNYKTLHVAVMICATLVNTQTHTEFFTSLLHVLAQPADLKKTNHITNWL